MTKNVHLFSMFLPFICYMNGMLSTEKHSCLIKFLEGISLFGGVCTGDVCFGFQSQGGSIHFCALLPLHNGFLRLISGVISADFWWPAWQPSHFQSTYLHTESGIERACWLTACDKIDVLPNETELYYISWFVI